MPPLRDVGAALQHRYRQSKRVRVNAKGNLQLVAPVNRHYQPVKKKNFDTDFEEQDDSAEIGSEKNIKCFPHCFAQKITPRRMRACAATIARTDTGTARVATARRVAVEVCFAKTS